MDTTVIIIISVSAAVILCALAVFFFFRHQKYKRIKESEESVNQKVIDTTSSLANCFGGNDNIISISQKGSRVSVEVKDISSIDHKSIDSQLENVMYMGNKIVFVIGSKSEDFSRLLQENIEKLNK